MTAGGYYARFTNCKCFEKNAPMIKIETEDAGSLICTPDHKILTDKQKYREAEKWMSLSFRKHNNISTVKVSICAENTSSTMEKDCTEQFGNTTMVQFLMAQLSTISTAIKRIIQSAISHLFPEKANIHLCTLSKTPEQQCQKSALKQQKSGTVLMKVWNGIKSIMKMSKTNSTRPTQELVFNVEKRSKQNSSVQSFAVLIAPHSSGKTVVSTMKNAPVWSAETALSATNTLQKKPAPGYVAGSSKVIYARKAKSGDAYCLSVDATHSVVVNDGLVVANCYDCLSYLLLSDYDAEVQYGDAGNI
jgi:hypothetical protein